MLVSPKIIVGWREFVCLPDWHISGIRAKIDTGANTSAIDVNKVEPLPGGQVRFDVVKNNNHRHRTHWITADLVRQTVVRSSNGTREIRYVVSTTLLLGGFAREVEFTLVRRANMLCRMLIGRTALSPHYIVDVSKRYLTRKPKIKKRQTATETLLKTKKI
ncbi:MAG: ATP-dependent zinc protease [Chthoniobacterales bacterium]